MKIVVWLGLVGIVAGFGYGFWLVIRKHAGRKQAAEERLAAFMAQTMRPAAPKLDAALASAPAPKPQAVPTPDLGMQKLLFEAAFKAGEAGEAALSIQLYARLIARYPDGAFVAQARGAVDREKAKLVRS
jgi:TolA-binding protein